MRAMHTTAVPVTDFTFSYIWIRKVRASSFVWWQSFRFCINFSGFYSKSEPTVTSTNPSDSKTSYDKVCSIDAGRLLFKEDAKELSMHTTMEAPVHSCAATAIVYDYPSGTNHTQANRKKTQRHSTLKLSSIKLVLFIHVSVFGLTIAVNFLHIIIPTFQRHGNYSSSSSSRNGGDNRTKSLCSVDAISIGNKGIPF